MAETTSLGTLAVYIEAKIDQLNKGLTQADKQIRYFAQRVDTTTQRISRRFQGLGNFVNRWGKRFAIAGVAGVAAVGYASVKMGAQFEQAMARVGAISGAVGKDFDQLRNLALKLGRDTEWSARQASEAMTGLAMAGFQVNEIMDAMPGLLAAATAGKTDLATATNIVASVLRGFGLEASRTLEVSDILSKTFTSAKVTMTDLGESLKYVGPIAKAAGLSLEETAAIIGTLGDAGIEGSMGGTQLRFALRKLLETADPVTGMVKKLGITVLEADGNMRPFVEIVKDFEKANFSAAQMTDFFGRAATGMITIVDRGSEHLSEFTNQLENAGGTSKRIAEIELNTLAGQFTILKSSLEGLFISIKESFFGNIIKEMLEGVVIPSVNNLADAVSRNSKIIKNNLTKAMLLVIPVIGKFGEFMAELPSMLIAVAQAIIKVSKAVIDFFGALFTGLEKVGKVGDKIPDPVKKFFGIMPGAEKDMEGTINKLAEYSYSLGELEESMEGLGILTAKWGLKGEESVEKLIKQLEVLAKRFNIDLPSGLKQTGKEIKAMSEETLFRFLESLEKSEPLWRKFVGSAKKAFVEIGIDLKEIWEGFKGAMIKVWDSLGKYGQAVIKLFGKAGETLGPILQKGIMSAWGFVRKLFEAGMEDGGEAPMRVGAGGVIEREPTGVEAMVQGMMKAIDNFIARMPEIMAQIIEWIPVLVEKVVETLPILIKAFAEFIPELAVVLAEQIPILVLALIEQLPTIMWAIVEAIPILLEGFIMVLPELISAIVELIFIEMPDMIAFLIEKFIDLLPLIIQKVIASIPSIIIAVVKFVIIGMPKIVWALIKGILSNLDEIIIALVKGIASGIKDAISGLLGGFFQEGSWEIPRNMLAGIHKGEMVVPADIAEGVRKGVSGIGKAGRQINFTIHSLDPRGVKEVIRDDVIPILQEEEAKGRY